MTDAASRELRRRAAMVGMLMRHCVNITVAAVVLADPHSDALLAGKWLLAILGAWGVYRILTRSPGVFPALVDYLGIIAVCLAIPILAPDPEFHLFNSAPLAIAGTALISFGVAVPPRLSLPIALSIAAAYGWGGAAVIGWHQVGSIAALYYFLLQWVTSALLRYMVLRVAAEVDRARTDRQAAEVDQEVKRAVRSYEREQLALLHDTAASTLLMVGQVGGLSPRRLARQAQRDLDLLETDHWVPSPSRVELVGLLRKSASCHDTPVRFEGLDELWLPSHTGQPVVAAAREVMNNVDRHARANLLRISVSSSGVCLRDDGVGFDMDEAARGHGLPDSIIGRMLRAGGRAIVRSAPGAGTSVEIVWGAPGRVDSVDDAAADPDRLIDRIRTRYGLVLVAFALANLLFSVPYAGSFGAADWADEVLAGVAVAAVLAAIPGVLAQRWAMARVGAVALAVVVVLQPFLLPPGLVGGHAHWAQSGIGWCVLPLLLALPVRRGALVLLGYWTLGAVAALARQPTADMLVNIGLGTASILSVQLFALIFNGLVRDAAAAAHREMLVYRKLAARERVQRAIGAEYQLRYASLVDRIVPLLRELASGSEMTVDLQRRARTESRRLRALFDQAASFGHPVMQRLRTLIDHAEARGIDVSVELAGELPELEASEIERLVGPAIRAAEAAQSFVRLVVTGTRDQISVSVMCDPQEGWDHSLGGVVTDGDAQILRTGDSLWIEVLYPRSAALRSDIAVQ